MGIAALTFISKGSLKMKVVWAALTLASVLMSEAKQAPQGPPLLRCDPNKPTVTRPNKEGGLLGGISTECIELCKEYGKNNKDGEKYCADMVYCDGLEDGGNGWVGQGVCNFAHSDNNKCETDKDCGPLGDVTSGSVSRRCGDMQCFLDGGITIT